MHHNKSCDSNLVSSPFYAISMYVYALNNYLYIPGLGGSVGGSMEDIYVVNNIQDY